MPRFLHITSTTLLALMLALLSSCDVHEWPEPEFEPVPEPAPVPGTEVVLHLYYTMELPPYKDIIYEQGGNNGNTRADVNADDIYDVRYVVHYFRSTDNGVTFPTEPTGRVMASKEEVDLLNFDLTFALAPGTYKFMVWSDYSAQGSLDDRLYQTTDFSAITINMPHSGCDDYRDAFIGSTQARVDAAVTTDVNVDMERPMGKYRMVATDLNLFLSRAEELARAQWEAAHSATPTALAPEMPPINISDYKVVVRYPGYYPHKFNMYLNRPGDATTGVTYQGRILPLGPDEAELGFDYVFVNGAEAPTTVKLEIYDKAGNLVGATQNINVPVKRSKLTTVRGEFLTSKAQGGVGVDPGFDGDFIVVVN